MGVAEEIKPGGSGDAELFNEHVYRELRALAQVPDDFVNSGWDLDSLEAGGGKGGTLMARVGDTFIVKELSKGDHVCLLEIAEGLLEHVKAGETMLCPIYLHFCYHGRFFFAMGNSVGSGPFLALYDLKGCADDKIIERGGEAVKVVHKRIWNLSMWFGQVAWSEDRIKYFEGKQEARHVEIQMTAEQRERCLKSIERDTEWLAQMKLMDYSLLLAIKDCPPNLLPGGSGHTGPGTRPFVYKNDEGKDVAVYISIIDFLQKWTMGKQVARCLKCMECNKATVPPKMYASRFHRHFTNQMAALPDDDSAPSPSAKPVPVTMGAVAPPAGEGVLVERGWTTSSEIAQERVPISQGSSEKREAEAKTKHPLSL